MTTPCDSDQKKRTLDALERRFALAKAELSQQQKYDKKQTSPEGGGKKGKAEHIVSSSNDNTVQAQVAETDAPNVPSVTPYTKKGNYAFHGYAPSRGTSGNSDIEANGPAYSQICQSIHENLLSPGTLISSKRENLVDKFLDDILQNGDVAKKYTQGSRSTKINSWMLLDNCIQGRGTSIDVHTRALQKQSKRSKRHMSMKQHRKCGSLNLPQEYHKFDIFKPMHDMWKSYIMQLLKTFGNNQLAQCLLTADLHGAILQVAECKVDSFSGVTGIMIRETAETFGIITPSSSSSSSSKPIPEIITQGNKFRVVPKKGSVFIFQADCWKITLLGDKLASREYGS